MTVYVGDLLTATAASVTGKPTPTRTWQWLRNGTAISGATSSTYTTVEADLAATLSVKQIETNIAGTAEATSLTVGPVESFTVAQLFASGEEGAWYEPSTTTAFASATDLTPCGYGDGCGFLLDKSQGAGYSGGSFTGLGSELVENGTFNADTDWTKTGNWSISGGQASSGSNSTYDDINQDVGFSAGKFYEFKIDVVSVSASRFSDRFYFSFGDGDTQGSGRSFASVGITSTGSHTILISAGAVDGLLRVYAGGFTSIVIDNISVRELPGNHATQSNPDARPILARVPEGGRRNLAIQTQNFGNTYGWAQRAGTVSHLANQADGPFGDVLAADKITGTAATTWVWALPQTGEFAYATSTGVTYTFSVYVKSATGSNQTFRLAIDPSTAISSDFTATSEWQRFSFSATSDGTPAIGFFRDTSNNGAELYVSDWQIEVSSTATAYQKVVDQYDVTEAGVTSLEYLAFDGADDWLGLPNIPYNSDTGVNAFMGADTTDLQSDYRSAWGRISSGDTAKSFAPYFGGTGPSNYKPLAYDQNGGKAVNVVTQTNAVFSWQVSLTSGSTRTAITRVNQNEVSEAYSRVSVASEVFNALCGSTIGIQLPKVKMFAAVLRCAAPLTTQEITNTEAYMANRSGVTL